MHDELQAMLEGTAAQEARQAPAPAAASGADDSLLDSLLQGEGSGGDHQAHPFGPPPPAQRRQGAPTTADDDLLAELLGD